MINFLNLVYYASIAYLILIFLLILFPYPFQSLAMYLHWINYPFLVDWRKGGERFGFRAGAVKPFIITTPDGLKLGAWHIVPHRDVSILPSPNSEFEGREELSNISLAEQVFLYFHGNAGNRATYHRTSFYKILTNLSKRSHVITIDYRGFGNSSHVIPTEETLRIDSLSAFDWIVSKGVNPNRIILVGHSLGSGIATDLAYILSQRHSKFGNNSLKGLILLSGYSSIADAAIGYTNVPLLRPFQGFSWTENIMKNIIRDKLKSHQKLRSISCPILLLHGSRDSDIQAWQAKANFLEAIGGRINKQLVNPNGFWELRNKTFNPKKHSCIGKSHLPGDEGEFWYLSPTSSEVENFSPIWLVLLTWASHNDLSNHQLIQDSIESWTKQRNRT